MPTITLSWTDLALFALTAGLIGGIVIIGRSNVLPPRTGIASNSNKGTSTTTASKKKKNKSKKNPSSAQDPTPTIPSTIDQDSHHHHRALENSSTHHSLNHQPTSPSSVPLVYKNPPPKHDPSRMIDDQEFPPLLASTEKSSLTKNQSKPKRPFAERHQPPPRKTIVDDMIDEDVQKPLKMARVMNIIDPEPPLSNHSTQSISDAEEGWEKVPDSKRTRVTSNPSHPTPPSSRPANHSSTNSSSDQKLSKRQRQNAKKKEAVKALKAVQEAERLNQLSSHKRDQERLRMNAQTHSSSASKPAGKQTGGGMKAAVAEDGRLIWE